MNRLLVAFTALLAIPAHASENDVFEFMGENTEEPRKMTELFGSQCSENKCASYLDAKIAGRPMRYVVMSFHNGKLYLVIGSFDKYAYSDVLDAFVSKYGKPDSTTVEKVQNRMGASFDNIVTKWVFKGGALELESVSGKVDNGGFTFLSLANQPPKEKAPVDF